MKEYYASKDIALQRDNYICQKCGKPALTVAHRICKSKANKYFIMRYLYSEKKELITYIGVNRYIHHPYNLVTACNGNCNDSYNIGMKPGKSKKLIELIWSMVNENLSVKEIEECLK
jgi:5-methylcytosine-specific restriction endonuclease McrA